MVGAVAAWLPGSGLAQGQSATPSAEPLHPEAILQRIQETPITSQVFPKDSGDMAVLPWDDSGDTDLEGVLGAVLVRDDSLGEGDEAMVGAYIVHPTITSARERMQAQLGDGPSESGLDLFGNQGGYMLSEDGFALIALAVGPVIVSAFAQVPGERGPDAPVEFDAMALEARALGNMAGLLDHLRQVQQSA